MVDIFQRAMDESIPKVKKGNRGLRPLPSNILDLIREKKRLRRTLYRCRDPFRYDDIKNNINNLDRTIQGAISQHDSEHWISFLNGITMNERVYGKVKAAAGIRRSTIPALSDDNGTAIYIDEDKANIIADSIQGMITAPRPQDGSINIIEQEFNIRSPLVNFSENLLADGSEHIPELSLISPSQEETQQ